MPGSDGRLAPDLLKVLNRRPSIFEHLDDEEAQATFPESMALELKPREKNGVIEQLSLWRFSSDEERDHVVADFLSRKPQRYKVVVLFLEEIYLGEVGVDYTRDRDPNAFLCVQDLHVSADFESHEVRLEFAEYFLTHHQEGSWSDDKGIARLTKGVVIDFLNRVAEECVEDIQVLLVKAPSWFELRHIGEGVVCELKFNSSR